MYELEGRLTTIIPGRSPIRISDRVNKPPALAPNSSKTGQIIGVCSNAVEAIGYFYSRGFRLTGLYEYHGDIAGATGLKWYIGPGAHVGFYNGNSRFDDDNDVAIGIDGVLGLDYKFRGAPINMSLDWQPAFEFGDGRGFSGSWGGLGIRYTF